jgi:hypothetical protein
MACRSGICSGAQTVPASAIGWADLKALSMAACSACPRDIGLGAR